MDCKSVEKTIVSFIKNSIKLAGLKDAVVGLSGGIDSSLVAALAINSLGKKYVHGLILPYKTSAKENISDAQELAQKLGISRPLLNYYLFGMKKNGSLAGGKLRKCILIRKEGNNHFVKLNIS